MENRATKEVLLFTLPGPEPKSARDRLRAEFPQLDVIYVQVEFDMKLWKPKTTVPKELWHSATILCTLISLPDDVSDAPNLKLIHLISASSNQIEGSAFFTDTNITITTSSGVHAPQLAEWSIMSRLTMNHRYNVIHGRQQRHEWRSALPPGNDDTQRVSDLVGCRIGILGYGSIGRQIGRVANALGMKVVAYTATPRHTPEQRRDSGFIIPGTGDPEGQFPVAWYSGLSVSALREFLRQDLDWLVVAVPLTKQTHHLLGAEEFKLLSKDGTKPVFFTNIARGPIVNHMDLIVALKNGALAGAALDVTDPEPLPVDSELWDMENVFISPHIAGLGQTYLDRSFHVLMENMRRSEAGETLLNVLDRRRGY